MMHSSTFGAVYEEELVAERRKALRLLLRKPLITIENPEEFTLARRHLTTLNEWLGRNAGWTIFYDSETIRLRKCPADANNPTHGIKTLDDKKKQAFNPRRYAIFCLAIAALGRGDRQTTLGRLFEGILQLALSDPELQRAGLYLDPNLYEHRRDLVGAVRYMLELNLLKLVDGNEQAYLGGKGDVLYNVNRSALTWVLNLRRSPATIESDDFEECLDLITRESLPDTPDGRNRAIRLKLTRHLLDDPVVYFEDLGEEELAYLQSQKSRITSEIEKFTGLRAEMRAEGIAMVDESGDLTDLDMPREGTTGHITLLTAQFLASKLKGDGARAVGLNTIYAELNRKREEFGKYWRKDAREPGALERIVNDAITHLIALDLAVRSEDGIAPRPAIARYFLEPPQIIQPRQGVLFE